MHHDALVLFSLPVSRMISHTCGVTLFYVIAEGLTCMRGKVLFRHCRRSPEGVDSYSSFGTVRSVIFNFSSFTSFWTTTKYFKQYKFSYLFVILDVESHCAFLFAAFEFRVLPAVVPHFGRNIINCRNWSVCQSERQFIFHWQYDRILSPASRSSLQEVIFRQEYCAGIVVSWSLFVWILARPLSLADA